MDELFPDLNDSRFDFSAGSLIRESLFERLTSKQMHAGGSRISVRLDALEDAERGAAAPSADRAAQREQDLPETDKGRGK